MLHLDATDFAQLDEAMPNVGEDRIARGERTGFECCEERLTVTEEGDGWMGFACEVGDASFIDEGTAVKEISGEFEDAVWVGAFWREKFFAEFFLSY